MPPVKHIIPSEEIIPNVLKVLDLIVASIRPIGNKNLKPYRDAYSDGAVEGNQPKLPKSVGKQCVALVNKCLYSHRYEEAAKLLWILCQDRSVFEMFIFKASMIVLENIECQDKNEVMWKFLSEIQNLELINKKEVQLEYIIYSLIHNAEDVKEKSQTLISMKRKNYLRKNPLLDPILDAYCIILECIDLLNTSVMPSSQADNTTNETILKFTSLIENPGDWDIFVLKLIELCSNDQDRTEEVKDILLKYVQCNPSNLSAHIYFSAYLKENDPQSEKLMEHLEIISKMSPSDERVLWLLEKLNESGKKLKKCLKLAFMFLDYPTNGKNLKAWRMLSEFLDCAVRTRNEKALLTLQICWVQRHKSWNWIYYQPSQVTHLTNADNELVAYKVKVLSYFNLDHAYIVEVTKKFPSVLDLLEVPYHEPVEYIYQEGEKMDDNV